jgi:hypothetical protein
MISVLTKRLPLPAKKHLTLKEEWEFVFTASRAGDLWLPPSPRGSHLCTDPGILRVCSCKLCGAATWSLVPVPSGLVPSPWADSYNCI